MSLVLLFRIIKMPLLPSSPFSHSQNRLFLQAFQLSSFSLTFSLYISSSHFNDHGRFSRCFTRFALTRSLSLGNFSLLNTALPKTRTSPYRKWLFPSSTKPFRNSNGVTLCRDTMGRASNVEDNKTRSRKQPDGGVEEPYSPRHSLLLSARRGHRRATFVSHWSFPSLTIITIVVRLNIMTRRNCHSAASTMRRADWSADARA